MSLYTRLLRPALFSCDPEWIHNRTIDLCASAGATAWRRGLLGRLFSFNDPRLESNVAGLHFANPVGLAAGFDKNGRAVQALAAIGFGFIEVGSISAGPSSGNARPRLFRLPADEAIVVNYGVPNDGAPVVARRLGAHPIPVPLGVNLVETNTGFPTPPDSVVEEFVHAVRPFVQIADYITLNLNCPNTSGGTSPFNDLERLRTLLGVYAEIAGLPPVFLKFTVHADPQRMDQLFRIVEPFSFVKGFMFNLPPGKNYVLRSPRELVEPLPGTLCGQPVQGMIDAAIRAWYLNMDRERYRIIGVGGLATAVDAYRKIRLGASLVQLYTALVYRGPAVIRQINEGLTQLLDRDGFVAIADAVGVGE